jgi:glycosyltransferase involved in cell wall biosynthesis
MSKLRVGVIYQKSEVWTGRENYYRNLFAATKSIAGEADIRYVLLKDSLVKNVSPALLPYIDGVLEMPQPLPPPDFWKRQRIRFLKRLGMWREPASYFGNFLRSNDINVVLSEVDLDSDLGIPIIGWIPDFQHLHFPNFFSEGERNHRNELFKRLVANSNLVILSSQDARHDFEQFTPEYAAKARILSFVSQLPENVYQEDPADICIQYHLPSRFIYLPNQFWMHKNHQLVVEALKLVYDSHPDITIVCTGNTNEYRNPAYFSQFMAKIASEGLRDRMIILGLVPFPDIFKLIRQSLAVLQPSLFEGWSTTVEEVKSLGKPIILSDIPVHREQNPSWAVYFDPHDPSGLARCLEEAYETYQPGPELALEEAARKSLPRRTREFAGQFLRILDEANKYAD